MRDIKKRKEQRTALIKIMPVGELVYSKQIRDKIELPLMVCTYILTTMVDMGIVEKVRVKQRNNMDSKYQFRLLCSRKEAIAKNEAHAAGILEKMAEEKKNKKAIAENEKTEQTNNSSEGCTVTHLKTGGYCLDYGNRKVYNMENRRTANDTIGSSRKTSGFGGCSLTAQYEVNL